MKTALLLLVFVNIVYMKYFILGPSEIKLTKVVQCPEFKNLPVQLNLQVHMYNKTTQVLDGKLFVPFPITSEIGIKLKCGKKQNNKMMPNAYTLEDGNLCEALNRYVGNLWWYVEENIGMEPGKCPLKKGNYSISNLYLDLSKMKIQMILEGTMFTRIQFIKEKKSIFCMDFELVTSKKTG